MIHYREHASVIPNEREGSAVALSRHMQIAPRALPVFGMTSVDDKPLKAQWPDKSSHSVNTHRWWINNAFG
jgi:hypothetical protein